jgi:hypothetical protein
MKTTMKLVLFVLLDLAVFTMAASAQTRTDPYRTDALSRACSVSDTAQHLAETMMCTMTIGSFRRVIDAFPVLSPDRKTQLHIDATASNGQLERVFVSYVAKHPEVENKDSLLVFWSALEDAGLLTETRVELEKPR